MLLKHFVSGDDRLPPRVCLRTVMPSDLGNVIDRRGHSRHALVVLCAGLPPVRKLLAAHPQLIWAQSQQLIALTIENSLVRSKKLVTRAGKEIGIDLLHVDQPVWCI